VVHQKVKTGEGSIERKNFLEGQEAKEGGGRRTGGRRDKTVCQWFSKWEWEPLQSAKKEGLKGGPMMPWKTTWCSVRVAKGWDYRNIGDTHPGHREDKFPWRDRKAREGDK